MSPNISTKCISTYTNSVYSTTNATTAWINTNSGIYTNYTIRHGSENINFTLEEITKALKQYYPERFI